MTIAQPLSSWWAKRTHQALGSTTDQAVRLALALGAVKSIVRVVDRTVPPLSVDWASVDDSAPIKSMSYTDFKNHAIRLNPMPILDASIGHGGALDICAGFGLHEASHSQESRSRYQYLVKKERHPNGKSMMERPAFEPMRIAAYLWNLVEDVRIESVTGRNWPGFVPYFGAVLDYMWSEARKHHELPIEYKSDITSRLRTVYLACRYPGRVEGHPMMDNSQIADEIEWWQAWQHDYLSDAVDTPATIQRGLDHLAEDEETKAELEQNAEQERAERKVGEALRAQIDRLIREGIGDLTSCANDEGDLVPLDEETAEAVRKLVRENLTEHRTVITTPGAANAPVLVSKPEETRESRRAYVGRPDATTEALRAALVFRPSAPQHDQKLLKSGVMDDGELYRWGLGDMRVFSEHVIESKPDVFLGLLCDVSGSMAGPSLRTVQRLAQLLVWATKDEEGVETAVWAHTADLTGSSADVFRVWERGDPLSRLGLLSTLDNGNNRDHQAVEYVASQIALAEQPERCLIVLSDGRPSADGLGGSPAHQAVRNAVRWAAGKGVRVIQVAVSHDLRPQEQAAMYPEWLPFSDYAALPRQIGNLLRRFM